MLELQAEAILKEMKVDQMREAAKVGIMIVLILTGKTVKTIKNFAKED